MPGVLSTPLVFPAELFPQEHAFGADPSVLCSWVARPHRAQGGCCQALALPVTTKDDVALDLQGP